MWLYVALFRQRGCFGVSVRRNLRAANRASSPHHTLLHLLSSFCSFPTTVYLYFDSLFISWEGSSRPLCTLPLRSVYRLGLWLPTTLPCLPFYTGRQSLVESHDTQLPIICGAHCIQFPKCPFVVYYNQSYSADSTLVRFPLSSLKT